MRENYFALIAKKKIQIALTKELYRKEIIEFYQYNHIIKSLEKEMLVLVQKLEESEDNLYQVTFTKII